MVIHRKSGINIILFLFLILGMTSRVVSDELPLEERLASEGFSLPTEDRPEAPDFSLKLLGGDEVKLSDYRGKVVFMNFWATWCGPCRFEMPSMQRLYDSVASDQFEIIAVNLREDEDMVDDFMEELGLTFPVMLDTTGYVGSVYGVRGIPTTFLLDKQGRLIGRIVGTREWDTPSFEALIKDLMAEEE